MVDGLEVGDVDQEEHLHFHSRGPLLSLLFGAVVESVTFHGIANCGLRDASY